MSKKHRDQSAELQNLLNSWNPLGIPVPPDEYLCLVDNLLSMLYRKSSKIEIIQYLTKECSEHFGIELKKPEVENFAEKLINWYLDNWVKVS